MRNGAIFAVLVLLAGCGTPDPNDDPAGRADTRQIPTNTDPGIHISGHANVGVIRRY